MHLLQVYAANHGSSMARGRWAARGVDMLLQQHPSLRVAYIDTHCSAEQVGNEVLRSGIALIAWWGSTPACG